MRYRFLLVSLLLVSTGLYRAGWSKIDLVTLPARDQTQITIYNSNDLTLVRETRTLTFSEGRNRIEFSWANTLIDPTSPRLFFLDRPDTFEIADITYPANTRDLLVWNVDSVEAGPARIEIVYFISGLTWKADYVVKANAEETAVSMEGYVRVENQSGEEFVGTQTRLLVGTINLVETIADLARRGFYYDPTNGTVSAGDVWRVKQGEEVNLFRYSDALDMSYAMMSAELKEVAKQAVSEYQLYTIEGTEDLPNGWAKRLRSFSEDDIQIELAYEFDEAKYGSDVVKFYKLKNDSEHNLGNDPFPDGVYRVYRENPEGGLVWIGQHTDKYVPVGEKLEMNLGWDGKVIVEPRRIEFERLNLEFDSKKNVTGWDERSVWRLEVRNSQTRAIPIKITRQMGEDWDWEPKVDPKTVTCRKKDQSTVELETTVAGRSSVALEYEVTVHFGTRTDR